MDEITRWITATALPLDDPLGDVRPVAGWVGDARVVALGAATRLSHELGVLAHGLLRALVLHHGFRALYLEGDEPASAALDAGADPAAVLSRARSFWRNAETLDVLRVHPRSWTRAAFVQRGWTKAALAQLGRGPSGQAGGEDRARLCRHLPR